MKTLHTQQEKEKALLVIVLLAQEAYAGWSSQDCKNELRELARSANKVEVMDEIVVSLEKPRPDLFIGKGKAEEIHTLIHLHNEEIDTVIFNENLSSTQQRNLEEALGVKVIDRTQLILDIFARRAHSIDGKLQVELAQLEYLKPRLTGKGVMLSRLGGGIGTSGPGEQKLEVDRRRISKRISKIREELKITKQRRLQRRYTRKEHYLTTVALVGYTNAGKSTLLKALTNESVYIDDMLFSTLDTTSHQLILPNNQKILLIDTVGFLHNLPHGLIEAFKATLEEVIQADLLIHVADISNPSLNQLMDSVYKVLKELDAENKPMIVALNKIDKAGDNLDAKKLCKKFNDCIAISAIKKEGLSQLIDMIMKKFSGLLADIDMLIPYHNMNLLNMIYNEGNVLERKDTPEGIRIKAQLPMQVKEKILTKKPSVVK
ncbi:MAG: GTPase HflX [Candidatus Omnitrophica bacterium]|nr:GTPase HflX [Candidatus Omnitrophota bacterium]